MVLAACEDAVALGDRNGSPDLAVSLSVFILLTNHVRGPCGRHSWCYVPQPWESSVDQRTGRSKPIIVCGYDIGLIQDPKEAKGVCLGQVPTFYKALHSCLPHSMDHNPLLALDSHLLSPCLQPASPEAKLTPPSSVLQEEANSPPQHRATSSFVAGWPQ